MAATALPTLPPILKQLQHYLKTAIEYDKRDPIVAYFCRLYAVQRGIKIDSKSPESKAFLVALMDYLEQTKTDLGKQGEEAVTSEIVGQAHIENVAFGLFKWADTQDRASNFNKNVVKSFYTAGLIFDTVSQFGDPSEEVEASRKYAKWKAAYLHKCLKSGETPIPGPIPDEGDEDGVGADPYSGQPPQPPSNMNLAPDVNLHPVPGTHAPPSTPQDLPGASSPSQPAPQSSPRAMPRSVPQQPASADTWTPPPNPYGAGADPYYGQPPQPPSNMNLAPDVNLHPVPDGVSLSALQYQKGMKYCKFAISAMQYEDSRDAIANLNKALKLLTTGQDE